MIKQFIFITRDGAPLSIADRLKDEGREVVIGLVDDEDNEKMTKEKAATRLQIYENILEYHDAEDVLRWMEDLTDKDQWFVMFDYGDLWKYSERAVKMGFRTGVFPTQFGYELERDRRAGKAFAKKHYPDLKVAEAHEFKKVKDGIAFVQEQKDKIFVLKSEGSNAETVVPLTQDFDLARKQIIGALRSETRGYEKEGFTLEEKIQYAIELSPVMVFWNGTPLFSLVELENKPLASGISGRLTGGAQNLTIQTPMECALNKLAFPPIVFEMAKKQPGVGIFDCGLLYDGKQFFFSEFCCFDVETEILTRDGWKNHNEVMVGQEALSLNPKSQEIEWKPIVTKFEFQYEGKMLKIGNQTSFDSLVTPNHKFLAKHANSPSLKAVRADQLMCGMEIPRTGVWRGITQPETTLPEFRVEQKSRQAVKKGTWLSGAKFKYGVTTASVKAFTRRTYPARAFRTTDLAWFVGLWLAEGCFEGYYKGYPRSLSIAQKPGTIKRRQIESRLRSMGIRFCSRENGVQINNRQVADYFWNHLGLGKTHASTKFIPSFFKELDTNCLMELVAGYTLGDGHRHKGQWVCSTVSRRLADDLQEVFHKLGWVANIKFCRAKGSQFSIGGKTFTRRHDCYVLTTREKKIIFQIKKNNRTLVPYEGIVWDVEVAANHSMLVRRNGRAFFSSNSQRWGWDGIFSEIAMCGDESGEHSVTRHFDMLAAGQNPLRHSFGAAVRLFQTEPDGKRPDVYADGYAMDWLNSVSDRLFFYCIRKEHLDDSDEDQFVSVGYEKDLGVACGAGGSVQEAVDRAYEAAEGFAMTGVYYRPKFDMLSKEYFSSIINRWEFLQASGLIA